MIKKQHGHWKGQILMRVGGKDIIFQGEGNGQLAAVAHAICDAYGITVSHLEYSEHDLDRDPSSRGIAYFGLTDEKGQTTWGAGIDTDTMTASVRAFVSAINRMPGMAERITFRNLSSSYDQIHDFRRSASHH